MKAFFIKILMFTLLFLTSSVMAAGSLEEGMQELATEIVKNSEAKGKRSIAISSFQHINGDISELSNYISDELTLKLFNVPKANLEIIERSQLNRIFKEMQFNMSGVVDAKTIKKLGKLHGIDALVIGSITELGESFRINARLIDTETGKVFSAAGTTVPKTSTARNLFSHIIVQGNTENSFSSSSNTSSSNSSASAISLKSTSKGKTKIFKVDLYKYDIGDIPEELGSVTVNENGHIKGKRVLKTFQEGGLDITLPFSLNNKFEISFLAYYFTNVVITLSDEDEKNVQTWVINKYGSTLTANGKKYGGITNFFSSTYSPPRRITIQSKGRVIKFFIDKHFIASIIADPNIKYKKLKIQMKDPITEIADLTFTQK